jgi:hypothetical protein
MNNVVLITSIINTPNKPLSYTNTRSVFTRPERFEQTVNTINSVRKHIPNCKIILVECSHLIDHEYAFFNNNCEYFINLIKDFESTKHIFSSAKAAGEGTMTKKALEYLINNDIKFDNLFKITGRYHINNEFNYNDYNNNSNVFKQIDHISLYTSLYKINYNDIHSLLVFINTNFNRMINAEGYEIIFNNLQNIIKINLINNLGVTGRISVCGTNVIS